MRRAESAAKLLNWPRPVAKAGVTATMLTKDEARRIAANIAKLPELLLKA